ncbi:asparagine synthase (glutamine-hydrolyzing) [Anaerosinus massiliensis]|uniref:asparagine synthase (glutamine-hydrolyzing) n=1 Tax=Massilibacillus massiliensis TaxID=1806837 RepID=UPI000AA649AD|nr:asparagine synthase (glutamine-hydrolyzing) [Massilibacillus massiliensis]
MCGITGWIDWRGGLDARQNKKILSNMIETLTLRGPDDSGQYVKSRIAFGHRRLSVVDPSNGAQPMIKKCGQYEYVITYNGELYNTPELRKDLEAKGYTFATNCDTEVLLVSYIEYGPGCVEKLNGIFAFGIWDEAKERLFLARDRIGVKPLFYAEKDQQFIFGSEIKTILANPLIEPKVDMEGLAEIFMVGPARTPGNGVFRDIKELKPGHSLIYTRNGKRTLRYWSLESREHEDDFETTVAKVKELLIDTAKRQLVADVKVCTFLSGGLDSSALTALAARHYKENDLGQLSTYSVDYIDNEKYFKASAFQPNSDAPWVLKMVDAYKTDHHRILIDNIELAKSLQKATIARDFPGMADVDTSLYLFCREIKKGATVALSGECADEIFGGYPWFYREDMLQANAFPWSPRPAMRLDWLSDSVKSSMDLVAYAQSRYDDAVKEVPKLPGEDKVSARMREIFYLSLTRWMPTLLDRKDRMSMAFGLEVRVPYCDHRIVEYVWNVPWSMKNYQNREKGLLREALTGILPYDVLWRKKSPYPKTHHPEYLNIVRNWALDILKDPSSPLVPLINVEKINEIAKTDLSASNIPWFGQLMGGAQLFAYLIQADTWLRHYKVQIV